MARMCVLITVTTYPLPSRSYDELVCTAGVLKDGSWVRIYPIPFRFWGFHKYQWVELDLIRQKPGKDFRPESFRPAKPDLSDHVIISKLGTDQMWYERKEACLKNVYSNLSQLIEDSKAPTNVSLAAFKPNAISRLIVENDERQWKPEWLERLKQLEMFSETTDSPRVPIDKIPYKFKYQFEDDEGRMATMAIEDWEIGALYRNCLASSEGDENAAIEKVRQKYETDFLTTKDITFFLGTTLEHHRRRHTNPFTIVGVFYPPYNPQGWLL